MTSSNIALASLAASGTATLIFPMPVTPFGGGTNQAEFLVSTIYSAMAGTSGINVDVQVSTNGGSTYSASGYIDQVIKPNAATVLTSQSVFFRKGQYSDHVDHIKLTLTNLDATNAALYAVQAETYH